MAESEQEKAERIARIKAHLEELAAKNDAKRWAEEEKQREEEGNKES